MTEEQLKAIEKRNVRFDGGGFPRVSNDLLELTAEVRRLRHALQGIVERYEERDTGVVFVDGAVAWAMVRDARQALMESEE